MSEARLQTAICSVGYDDFLALTLPHNLPLLGSVTVLTSPRDRATISLAKRLGVQLSITNAWHVDGPLNKGRVLNDWHTHASAYEPDSWLMTLDADILLFDRIAAVLQDLNPAVLYSARRRMCADKQTFRDYREGKIGWKDLPCDTVPVINGRLWGTIDATNPAGLSGYLQLWCPKHSLGASYFQETGSAEAYDLAFGLTFPEESRQFLKSIEVLHLGPTQVNWNGRRSERWDVQEGFA